MDQHVYRYGGGVQQDPPVSALMKRQILSCPEETPLSQAAALMAEHRCSSILVRSQQTGQPVGLWTEHDALAVSLDHAEQPIRLVMSAPLISIAAEAPLHQAVGRFQEYSVRHLIAVEDDQVVGIISQTDLIRHQGVYAYLTLRKVRSLARRRAWVVQATDSVSSAIALLRQENCEAVVVYEGSALHGIITERDVLRLVATAQGVPLLCRDVCSHPLLSVRAEQPLLDAHVLMEQQKIRHLAVVEDDGHLLSLLSFRDILGAIAEDYTEKMHHALEQQGRALRFEEQRQRTFLETTQQGFVEFDTAGGVIRVNSALCQALGWTASELSEKSLAELCTPASVQAAQALCLRLQTEQHASEELVLCCRDGHTIPYHLKATALHHEDGSVLECFAFLTDLSDEYRHRSELQALVDQVSASNTELEDFAYVVSHDLQQPLRMVSSYLGLLTRRFGQGIPPEGHEFINYAVDGSKRMQSMIIDLLEYSRINHRGGELTECESEACLSLALSDVAIALQTCGGLAEHGEMPVVLADAFQLRRVFHCLLDNAILYRALERPLRIEVSARELPTGGWEFSVKDNGIGIEEQNYERVFQIFQRLHPRQEAASGGNDTLGRGTGNGIGLALCRRIIERHGGRIWVNSDFGAGTTVSFTVVPSAGARRDG